MTLMFATAPLAITRTSAYIFPMPLTPREIFDLMFKRHLQPWNWLLQMFGLALVFASFAFHGYLLFASGMILIGTGFFNLHMPDMPNTQWTRCLNRTLIKERRWARSPMTTRKILQIASGILMTAVVIWALWTLQLAVLLALSPFPYLVYIALKNKRYGIDP